MREADNRGPGGETAGEAAHEARIRLARDGGLITIGVFKLAKSILFFCIGVGALHFLHKDLMDAAMRLAMALRFDTENHFISTYLAKLDMVNTHRLKVISVLTFGYSALALVEGIGLMMEKVWAEYLTLSLTIAFLPWELYELTRKVTTLRVGVLVTNLIVLGYLLWLLRRKRDWVAGRNEAG